MLYKKVLSLFENEDGLLDFDLFAELCESSESTKESLLDLSMEDLNLMFKLLIDNQQFKTLAVLIKHLEEDNHDYSKPMVAIALIKNSFLSSDKDFKGADRSLSELEGSQSLPLLPFIKTFPDKIQKKIEASFSQRRDEVNAYREELKEQIEFLKSQMLTEKAVEIEEKLKFHFPEIKDEFFSPQQAQSRNEEQRFAKAIERNLSFILSENPSQQTEDSVYDKSSREDEEASLEIAELWQSEMEGKNLDLLLTQLEFLNFDNPHFFSKLLKNSSPTDTWTKLILFIKSARYLEGLDFLEKNEHDLLTKSPESIYNFYYTKGLLLLGAGMNKEAEEIFLIIKEQKDDFRHIRTLLQNAK